jgi:hypothetical protein
MPPTDIIKVIRQIFNRMMRPIKDNKRLRNLNAALIATKALLDGTQYRSISTSGGIAIQAGKTVRTIEMFDLGSVISGFDPTEDNTKLIIDRAIQEVTYYCTDPFIATPFLIDLENGESVATTDSDYTDPLVAIDAIKTGSTYTVKLGQECIGTVPQRSGGTIFYQAKSAFDVTEECRKYIISYYRRQHDEETATALKYCNHVLGVAEKTINVVRLFYMEYHFEQNKRGAIL